MKGVIYMIPWLIGVGIAAAIGAGAVYVFTHWREVLDWFRGFLRKVSNVIREIGRQLGPRTQYATEAVAKILDRVTGAIEHHLYVHESQGWTDTVTTTKVQLDELPPRVKSRVRTVGDSAVVTDVMENELGMSF